MSSTIEALVEKVGDMQLQLVVLNERLPAHVESTDRRLGEHDVRLKNHGDRLYEREKEAIELRALITAALAQIAAEKAARESATAKRAPWWNVVGAVVGIIAGLGTTVTLIITFASLIPAIQALK